MKYFATRLIRLSLLQLTLWWPVATAGDLLVRHNGPSASWREADPMGNGRLGAMVWGGTVTETINLNEDTLWSGEPEPHTDGQPCRDNLQKVRDLIFSGKEKEAHSLANRTMSGKMNQCYEPLGNLTLSIPASKGKKAGDYRRQLDISRALHETHFSLDGITYKREVFVSHPDDVMAVRVSASRKQSVDLDVSLSSLLQSRVSGTKHASELILSGRAPIHATPHYADKEVVYDEHRGMRFAGIVRAIPQGGTCKVDGKTIQLRGCDSIVLIFAGATSFNGFDKSPSEDGKDETKAAAERIEKAAAKTWADLKERHIADYKSLFDRVFLDLGDDEHKHAGKAVSERIHENYGKNPDPHLAELFYQFGRYLLISSSREGSQPANLQGIWSYKINPWWSANWTTNCNAQFNYSGAAVANLDELTEPLLRMLEEAAVDGSKVAKSWYEAEGWVVHHNLDLWRAAKPTGDNMLWAMFPSGGTWLVTELFDHWRFSRDERMLKRLWPLLKGSAEFWLSHMVEDPRTGKLVSCPDVYFENTPTPRRAPLCAAPISTTLIIHQLFADVREAAAELALTDDPVLERITKTLPKLPVPKIGDNGEIWQWDRGNWKEADPTQLLVMWGAIYSKQIHPRLSPDLAKALKTMLDRRKLGLDGQGSWRVAFPAQTYARLGDGNSSLKVFDATMRSATNPNLTTNFNKTDWEIDGNLGMMTALMECLVQSHADEVELLPALPDAWAQNGSVRGVKVRGNMTIDFAWENGRITKWTLRGTARDKVKVRVNGELVLTSPATGPTRE